MLMQIKQKWTINMNTCMRQNIKMGSNNVHL